MEFDEVVNTLGIEDCGGDIRDGWEASRTSMPADEIGFLTESYLREVCTAVYLPDETIPSIIDAALRIRNDRALTALTWHCRCRLFHPDHEHTPTGTWPPATANWPLLTAALDQDAGLFNVIILLSGTQKLQTLYAAKKIPARIFHDTVRYLTWYIEEGDYHQDFGHCGLTPRALGWLAHYWRGRVFRIGRLTFAFDSCRPDLRVFRHRTSGVVIALSGQGIQYRSDGQIDGAGGATDPGNAWTSTLTVTEKAITGHPIDPRSYALREPISLDAAIWKQELAPGDPVIAIHIAAGSPMQHEECGKSLVQALDFFQEHFPDRPFTGFTCHSWILDAQFEELLNARSNLVRFQQEMYLFPIRGNDRSVLDAVFGRKVIDIADAPRETSMQRAFARHIENGGHFRSGGCFLLPNDIQHWGSQFYRSQTLPWS